MRSTEFVIWADSYDENVGGVLALHALCARLNDLGHRAALWPSGKPGPGMSWRDHLYYWRHGGSATYRSGPFQSPIATIAALASAVVIYPEVVSGNPLKSSRVTRWLLHKPGYHTGRYEFGSTDLFFFYQDAFNDPDLNLNPQNRLTVTYIHPAYRNLGLQRRGTCYMMRKGAGRAIVHDLSNSVRLDGMSHEEIAMEFNRAERFYCYDLYSLYAWFAALCGCIPIVVPDPTLSKEAWHDDPAERYGVAYGEQDIPWAIATHKAMVERFSRLRDEENDMIRRFVITASRFNFASPSANELSDT